MSIHIPIGDLRRQQARLRREIDAAVARVIDSGWYVLGHEVDAFEHEFAAYCGVRHGVGVASGAEALYLALAALQKFNARTTQQLLKIAQEHKLL